MTWSQAISDAAPVLLTALAAPLAAILGALLWKAAAWFGYQATAQNKDNMERDLQAALNFGITQVLPKIKEQGWNSPEVHALILSHAADYMKQRFPDRTDKIEAAGLTSPNPLNDTLGSRLPDAIKTAANSPATPPATDVLPRS